MKECVAMILAGGQGSRLGVLTKNLAKPAVPFGGKYKIIDFTLSNCTNSGIDTVGVLTQYQPLELSTHIGSGAAWDLDRSRGGVYILPPYTKAEKGEWYKGTANAIYQNLGFIEQFEPSYVLVLSGDHIYKMDYGLMLEYHRDKRADATIAVINVKEDEAPRFGIMNTARGGRITEFEEKPENPKSTLASMGVYIFNWLCLKRYLIKDENDKNSKNDFGANIIPSMLKAGEKLFAYRFRGYWKDVGTIESLWAANMDLLKNPPAFDLHGRSRAVYCRDETLPPHFVHNGAEIRHSFAACGSDIYGRVENSVIFPDVFIGKGAVVRKSVIMPGARVGEGSVVDSAVVGAGCKIGENVQIGTHDGADAYYSDMCMGGISAIGAGVTVADGAVIGKNSMIENSIVARQEVGRKEYTENERHFGDYYGKSASAKTE